MVVVWFVVCVVIIVMRMFMLCGVIVLSNCYFSSSVMYMVIVLNVLMCELCMMCSWFLGV